MNFTVALLLGLVALISAETMVDFELDDMNIHQDLDDDTGAITGEYTFTSPEGTQFFVKYIADTDGFRVLESNAVPVSSDNVRADGNQGSFTSDEDDSVETLG
ncbi:unnamed protein product, partial [Meganyctiphanes norvegica]